MIYHIKIEKFEGPLDLLLELIEKEKMDITEISLSRVAGQYLEFIEKSEVIDPSNLADFLSVAAKLILLKSKALLPDLDVDEEEEEESIEELKLRLQEYKRFKEAAKRIGEIYNNQDRLFGRAYVGNIETAFYPGDQLDRESIFMAAKGLVGILSKFESLRKETILETISIKDKITEIQDMLSRKVKIKFNNIINKSKSKVDAIVAFLALLELIRQKFVLVHQPGNFSDIEIKSQREIN